MTQRIVVVAGRPSVSTDRRLAELLAGELARRGGGPVEVRAAPEVGDVGGAALVYLASRAVPQPEEAAAVAAGSAGAAALVVVGSSEIYEPSHRNPGLVDEDFQGRRAPEHPVARRWWDLEEGLRGSVPPTTPWVVLRAAPVPIPLPPGGDGDWASTLLSGGWGRTVPGCDPPLQLLALPDLAAAVERALGALAADPARIADPRLRGAAINVVPAQPVPVHRALSLAGVRRLPLPSFGRRGNRVGGSFGGRRAYLRHPWTAGGERAARLLGFRARHSGAETAAALAAGDAWRPSAEWWAAAASRPDLGFDDHGMSPSYIAAFGRTLFRFLHDAWWRVEHRGVEGIPARGGAVLVGVHRGFMPWDGVMALHLVHRETGRIPRFLIHPALVKYPFMADYMRRLGGVLATRENADRLLHRDGVVAIFPEGIHGAFTPYRRAYRLGSFGRRDYVRIAIAHGVPIVPFVTVGSAEIFPILGRVDWRWIQRLTEWPYLPLTPNFPWTPLPLPSKWHTRFLDPVPVADRYPPSAAADAAAVAELGTEIEATMQRAIDEMLARRRSIWRGSLFGEEERGAVEATAVPEDLVSSRGSRDP